jgi:hypothetical protein
MYASPLSLCLPPTAGIPSRSSCRPANIKWKECRCDSEETWHWMGNNKHSCQDLTWVADPYSADCKHSLLAACYLLCLFFHPEDESDMFLQNFIRLTFNGLHGATSQNHSCENLKTSFLFPIKSDLLLKIWGIWLSIDCTITTENTTSAAWSIIVQCNTHLRSLTKLTS